MAKQDRYELIKQIESERKSRVLCYVTGDRQGLETKIAMDTFSFVYDHLSAIGKQRAIDLFLYSTGGLTIAGWALVNLIHEFCEKFSVIIPFKALSCATLISIGADEIIMGKLGQLSPIDPSVNSPYNPLAPEQQHGPRRLLPVNVEDAIGYLNLAKKEGGLKGDAELCKIVEKLSDKVHPLALGGVYRAREQIKMLARKLLSSHMKEPGQEKSVESIITMMTEELFSHDYIISRNEAKEHIGLNIIDIDESFENIIWKLYKNYEDEIELTVPYNPELLLGTENEKTLTFNRAFIESFDKTTVFRTKKIVRRITTRRPDVPVPIHGFEERLIKEGWEKD
jgi:sulfur relay (sulfurtransferase) DsrC/TusE family protein